MKPPTPAQRHREALAERATGCALSYLGECDGRLEADHVIGVQQIKTARGQAVIRIRGTRGDYLPPILADSLDDVIADGRNAIALCQRHHHLKTVAALTIPRDFLPPEVEEFAAEYGLETALARITGERQTA
jgi:hypothetical protein